MCFQQRETLFACGQEAKMQSNSYVWISAAVLKHQGLNDPQFGIKLTVFIVY